MEAVSEQEVFGEFKTDELSFLKWKVDELLGCAKVGIFDGYIDADKALDYIRKAQGYLERIKVLEKS